MDWYEHTAVMMLSWQLWFALHIIIPLLIIGGSIFIGIEAWRYHQEIKELLKGKDDGESDP